jgi:cell division protein FtsW
MPQQVKTDNTLFFTTVGLVFFGLMMVYSASSVMAMQSPRYHSSTYFVIRHALYLGPALLLMLVAMKWKHYSKLQTPAVAFVAIGLVTMLLFLVYFLDPDHHRWLRLGFLNIQPAELAKPAIVLFLAYFVAHRAPAINNRYTLWPAVMTIGLVILFVGIPDLGTAVVLAATAGVVFFVAGLERRYCIFLLVIAMLVGGFAIVSKPYRLARIVHYFDPDYKLTDRLDPKGRMKAYLSKSLVSHDTNYQGWQSELAVGAGGPAGLGLMQGKQKLLYLPEAHTDFIYAVVCEELGLGGSLGVLAAFCVILWRGLRASVRAENDFGKYLALAVTTLIVVQAFMNMTVVLAMAPTKGIPLPMISFGGNSLVTTLGMMGMLMNVSENTA